MMDRSLGEIIGHANEQMRELELSIAHTDRMLKDYREDNGAQFFDTST